MIRCLPSLLPLLFAVATSAFSQIGNNRLLVAEKRYILENSVSDPLQLFGTLRPLPSALSTPNSTRALVIGISDYQSPQLPDLQYASRSAEAFAAWMQSPAGGQLRSDRLHLLTDERATLGGVTGELDWLVENCAEDDLVVVYISGQLALRNTGLNVEPYLLVHDSPQTDLGAGACAVQTLAKALSLINDLCKGQVILVADWIIPGEFAATSAGAASMRLLTDLVPAEDFSGVLSCQPEEVAWKHASGSAGLFTQICLEALYGMADEDHDQVIRSTEFRQYLEHQQQLPFPLRWWGTESLELARVDADFLDRLLFYKSKPIELQDVISEGSSNLSLPDNLPEERIAQYYAFKEAILRGDLIDPPGYSAWDLYRQMPPEQANDRMGKRMRRELCAALQDESQQALNALLESDPYEITNWRYNASKYNQYPEFLRRAQELLGESHYLNAALRAKRLYFEAYSLSHNNPDLLKSQPAAEYAKRIAKAKLQEALQYQPDAAYLYQAVGFLHFSDYALDSFMYYYTQAIDLSPTWILPYLDVGQKYMNVFVDLKMAEQWYKKALEIHPTSYIALEKLAQLYKWKYQMASAVATCQEMIRLRPELPNGYAAMGNIYLAVKDYAIAERYVLQALEMNPKLFSSYVDLGAIYMRTLRYEKGRMHFERALANPELAAGDRVILLRSLAEAQIGFGLLQDAKATLDRHAQVPTDFIWEAANREVLRGKILALQGSYTKADSVLQLALILDATPNPYYISAYAYRGVAAAGLGRIDSAFVYFQHAITYSTNVRFVDQMFYADAHYQLGRFYLGQHQYAEARKEFRRAIKADQGWYAGFFGMAYYYAARGKRTLSLDYLERAFLRHFPDRSAFENESAFNRVRATSQYTHLMEKYFPEKL